MNVFKINLLVILSLFFLITSCNEDDFNNVDKLSSSKNNNNHINTTENRSKITTLLENENNYKRVFEDNYKELVDNFEFTNYDENLSVEKNLINEYSNCSNCNDEIKSFLIPMFNELLRTDNQNIKEVLEQYEQEIENLDLSYDKKQNLKFMFFTFNEGVNTHLEKSTQKDFWDCMAENGGQNIGRGLVGGFLGGCLVGGYIGATAGSVTVPVIGTVIGGTAGCIASGAVSGTIGAAFGAFWTAADCAL